MKNQSRLIQQWTWQEEIRNRESKTKIAETLALKVQDGEVIGAGSGSTSFLALQAIARRIQREQLDVMFIPTSLEITLFCNQLGLPVTTLSEHIPDWSFDGTDEVDLQNNLIKGRGGAMFKEKLLICSCPKVFILADKSKRVEYLGQLFPVPVEVFPMALPYVEKVLQSYDPVSIQIRTAVGKDGPVITENGNLILDVRFSEIPMHLEKTLKEIPGVIETGLFIGYKNIQIIDN